MSRNIRLFQFASQQRKGGLASDLPRPNLRPAVFRGKNDGKRQKVAEEEEEIHADWDGLDETESLRYLEKDDSSQYPDALEKIADNSTNVSLPRRFLICVLTFLDLKRISFRSQTTSSKL